MEIDEVFRALRTDDELEFARCMEQKLIAEPNVHDICFLGAPRCLRWTLERYPGLTNRGVWCSHNPRERKPLVFLLSMCYGDGKLYEMVQILLEHGAEACEPDNPSDPLRFLMARKTFTHQAEVMKSGKLLIDYGALPVTDSPDSELDCYWSERQLALAWRRDARLILFYAMRTRMLKDVARLIVKSAPLAQPMSWKAWMPEHVKKQKKK